MNESLLAKKIKKSKRIKHILSDQVDFSEDEFCFNFLPEKIRRTYGLVETTNVSAHDYDKFALELINSSPNGLYLDCGCGKRRDTLNRVFPYKK